MKRILTLVLGLLTATMLQAVEDEPSELNWEFFSQDLQVFNHFLRYQSKNPAPGTVREICPKEFPAITVRPADFLVNASRWKVGKYLAVDVLQGRAGHSAEIARGKLSVTEPGLYRVWVKYFHRQNSIASFSLRILPLELLKETLPAVVSTKGEYYAHRFDWAEYNSKRPTPLPNHKDDPTGFKWESGNMVELAPGDYTIELAGLIHGGPYEGRRIALVVLTADPLLENVDEVVGRNSYPASDRTRQQWTPWCLRPGAVPFGELTAGPQQYYRQWRAELLKKLRDKPETVEEKRMAAQSYFDDAVNLIGTPADVAEEKQHMAAALQQDFSHAFVTEIEAESFQPTPGQADPWKITKSSNNASGGKILQTGYGSNEATASVTFTVPRAGHYTVWADYLLLHKFYSPFNLEVYQADGKKITTLQYGSPADRLKRKNNQFNWEGLAADLPAGNLTLRLAKCNGNGPSTYRRVDRFLITDNAAIRPEEYRKRISTRPDTLWQQRNPWDGFSQISAPNPEDVVEPRTIAVPVHQGDAASLLLHWRNDTMIPENLIPRAQGPGAPQVRLVGYLKTPLYNWSPALLLERSAITVPPGCNASLWLTFRTDKLACGNYLPVLTLGARRIEFALSVAAPANRRPIPIVGGWCKPLDRESCWQLFREIGLNLVFNAVVSKREMDQYNLKLLMLSLKIFEPLSPPAYLELLHRLGLSEKDWCAFLVDEPVKKTIERWMELAQKVKTQTPSVQIWCNPGEVSGSKPEFVRRMQPYIDVFCPYLDHFSAQDLKYRTEELPAIGKIKLLYTTPCFHEKSPDSPNELLYVGEMAAKHQRDGWAPFSLFAAYPYSNSVWDEMYPFDICQAISFYPGAYGRTLSTRNMEAMREAIQRYRK